MAVAENREERGAAAAATVPLFAALPVPAFLLSPAGDVAVNPAFTAVFGTSASHKSSLAFLSRKGEEAVHRDVRLSGRDGAMIETTVHLSPYRDDAGFVGFLGVAIDASGQRRAERGLDIATEKLEEAYRTGRLGYWEYAIRSGSLMWNDTAFAILGQRPGGFEPSFDGFLSLLHPDDRPRFGVMLESVIGNPTRSYVDFRVTARDGAVRHVATSCAPRFDGDGRLTHVFGVMMDTTERAEAEAALVAAKERLEEAQRTGRLGYWEYTIHTGALSWNREAFVIHGQDPDGFHPTFDGLLGLLHPHDQPRFGVMLEEVIGNSRRAFFEYRVIDPMGEVRYVSSSCAPRFDGNGRLSQVFGVMLDTTERARAQAALKSAKDEAELALAELRAAQVSLVQAEKMASLGQLVAGVAHEINGPVGVALTSASHLAGRSDEIRRLFRAGAMTKSALAAYLDMTAEACTLLVTNTERIAQLVQMFKQVAADQTGDERRVFYLRDYIEDVLLSLHTQIGPSGHRVTVACPDVLQVESYPGAFARVLTHLVRNALIHAFRPEQSGRITITAQVVENGEWVEVRHADDGQGILDSDRTKVFDPFFTTRRGNGCVGLGLHIAYNLSTRTLGGSLTLDSMADKGTRGQGAVFTLRIPRVAPPPAS